ncbi:glycosyltransferase [Telluribacter sp.]|jgi:cellulose synthase/poly-beta-1,6-N-acetylglucosamine synthase-like glycosyltransferase|uniref:glycosyltransferase n=1 Tax=Telluribacter sp. TaxID=1978767 RepID=UPI002E167E4E|nr:glycosyltransferase [Telluribacter sp.]
MKFTSERSKVSLVVAYYKNIPVLDLIFKALTTQSCGDFEVIVAEDDCSPETKEFIQEKISQVPFSIKHLYQVKDDGFRKNQMLNRAISVAEADLMVFLDGDCIPHQHFIKQYLKNAGEGVALFGRRVMLSQPLTQKLIQSRDLRFLSMSNLLFSNTGRLRDALYLPFINREKKEGIWGCNWGILRQHLMEVNGFDEDYIRAGVGEDVDIEWRLLSKGLKCKSMKHKAIVYHTYHKPNYSQDEVNINYRLMAEKQLAGNLFCLNGLQKQ